MARASRASCATSSSDTPAGCPGWRGQASQTRIVSSLTVLSGRSGRTKPGTKLDTAKRLGRVLSQVDMMLAALARQQRLALLTTDRDFEAPSDLAVENWVV